MDDSDLADFTPVALRGRRDGWTPERQRRFVAALARGLKPGRAAESVGMTRQSAYWLRARPGAGSFAAAWDGAGRAARARRAALRAPGEWQRAVEGVLRPIRYRGRIAAWDRSFDGRALVRLLGRVDKFLEKRGAAGDDYFGPGMPKLCQSPPSLPPEARPRKSPR